MWSITPGLVIKSDGNNVSLDREARLLAENALRFNVASNLMKAQLKMSNRPSRKANPDESVFGAFGQRFRDGGPAHAGRASGAEPGQFRDHAHARRRALPAPGRGVSKRARDLAVFRGLSDRNANRGEREWKWPTWSKIPPSRRNAIMPGHPDADKEGYVAYPNVNPAEDMVDLLSAQRGYEGNVAAMTAIKDMIQHSIDLMK